MEQKRKEYILRESIWRCGGTSTSTLTSRGRGLVKLLNRAGYQCCLGQFLEQDGVPRNLLRDKILPHSLKLPSLPEDSLWVKTGSNIPIRNTPLSNKLASINDLSSHSIPDKVEAIRKELKKYGVSLKFIPISEEG